MIDYLSLAFCRQIEWKITKIGEIGLKLKINHFQIEEKRRMEEKNGGHDLNNEKKKSRIFLFLRWNGKMSSHEYANNKMRKTDMP